MSFRGHSLGPLYTIGMSALQFPLQLTVAPAFLWAVFGVAAAVFGAVSWALLYHWRRFGGGSAKVALAETAYVVGGMALLAVAFVSLLAI